MAITNAHLHWFKLKCPYPQGSKAFRMAKAKLDNATYADLERLRAEFEMYKDGSSPVTHYHLYDEWFASVGGVQTEQVNMKGIQRHGTKFRVQCLAPYIRPLICGFSNKVSGTGVRMFNA